jgi:hypothetical protein
MQHLVLLILKRMLSSCSLCSPLNVAWSSLSGTIQPAFALNGLEQITQITNRIVALME